MLKTERQELILRLIENQVIETQQDLVRQLRAQGSKATQATVSRDIRELQLVKVAREDGGYRYAQPRKPASSVSDRMIRILTDSMVGVDHAGHMVVVKTLSGTANAAAEVLDALAWPEVLGTIAGDNTILMVARGEQEAAEVAERIGEYAGEEE